MAAQEQHTDLDFIDTSFIVNLPDPVNPQEAATKAYVDALILPPGTTCCAESGTPFADADPIPSGVVRNDAEGPLTGVADGDYTPLQVGPNGRLKVSITGDDEIQVVQGSSPLSVYLEDGKAIGNPLASDHILPIAAVVTDGTTTQTVTDGYWSHLMQNTDGELLVSMPGGVTVSADTSAEIGDAYSAAHRGERMLAVRTDSWTLQSGVADGQYGSLQMTSAGRLQVELPGDQTVVAAEAVNWGASFASQDVVPMGVLKIDNTWTTPSVDSDGKLNVSSELTYRDLDTGAGTDNQGVVGLVVPASGGSVTITGDATNGLDVDVTRVSGTVAVSAASLPLPSGAATSAAQTDKSQFTKLTDGTDTALVTAAGELNVIATAQPGVDIGDVTINNASGASAVNIQDGGNAISVDWNGTTPVTGSGTATGALRVELPTNGTGTVGLNAGTNAIGKLAANSGIDIGDVDVTSVIPGTGATNLGKAESASHTSGDVGVMPLAVRNDAGTALATDGQYIPLSTDSTGALRVATGSSGGGTSIADDAAFTVGTTSLTPVGGTYRAALDAVDSGDAGAFSMTQHRALYVSQLTPAGDSMVDDTADALKVTLTGTGTATTVETVGDVAEDQPIAGNPVRIGVRGSTTIPTAVSTNGDIVTPWASLNGAIVTAGRVSTSQPSTISDATAAPLWVGARGEIVVIPQVRQAQLQATPTISTSVFASGDQITAGGQSIATANLASGRGLQIVNATLLDKSLQKAWIEMWIFASSPTTVNANSNDAFSITDANMASTPCLGVIDFLAADYKDNASNSLCQGSMYQGPPTLNVAALTSTSLGYVLVARGTPTYTSSTDLVVTLTVNWY